jgi:hypothetical protein
MQKVLAYNDQLRNAHITGLVKRWDPRPSSARRTAPPDLTCTARIPVQGAGARLSRGREQWYRSCIHRMAAESSAHREHDLPHVFETLCGRACLWVGGGHNAVGGKRDCERIWLTRGTVEVHI